MRLRVLLAGVVLPLVLWGVLPLVSSGATNPAELSSLRSKIDRARAKIGYKRGKERVLTSKITSASRRINRLQPRINALESRQGVIEGDLDAKKAELEQLRSGLRSERARIVRLRNRFVQARTVLRARLVELYKTGQPDIVSVILTADGFSDLIDRAEFIKRISDQDRRIISVVRAARVDAASSEQRLARMERRQAKVTDIVQQRRDEIASVKNKLVSVRTVYSRTRNDRARTLRGIRSDRRQLEDHVNDLEAASAKITGQLNTAQAANAGGLPKSGGGPWIWPVNGPITGAFGEQRPGHIHAGIDIAVPIGTPIHAAAAGKVVLMQGVGASGGYGNYTCVQHTASLSSCYAHQSRFGTSIGARVSQGQIIGYAGNTGHSFGPHLHFEARVNGVPVQPLNYL